MDPVHSRTTTAGLLDFRRLQHGALALDGDFQPGVYVLLGDEPATLSQLFELMLGKSAPQRGEVRVNGADPSRAPAIRRRVGSLLWQEELPGGARVLDSVRSLLEIHGMSDAGGELATAALQRLELEHLGTKPPAALNSDERRGVALAVALALPQPLLLTLASPLSVRCADRQATLARLRELRKHAVILVATTDAAEAAHCDGLCLLFSAGRIVGRVERPDVPPAGATASLWVTSSDSGRLTRLLAAEPAVARFEAPLGCESVVIHGSDLTALSRTLLRVAHEHDIELLSLSQRVPSPHELWNQPRSERTTPVAPNTPPPLLEAPLLEGPVTAPSTAASAPQPAAALPATTLPPTAPEAAPPLPNAPVAPPTAASAPQPAAALPATAQPATALPATALPATAQPATAQPATALPATAQPATAQPATALPATAPEATTGHRSTNGAPGAANSPTRSDDD